MYRFCLSLFAASLLAGCGGQPVDALVNNKLVRIDSGAVEGAAANGVLSFKGIPYATPPVGPLRWRAPQPVAPWSTTRSAQNFGHSCMQLAYNPAAVVPAGTEPNEDCLVMNVWRPDQPVTKKMPVMVWIYGGGMVNGSSSEPTYDGSQFAKQGVLFVSFNYRVGRFGFFAHPGLSQENPGGPLGNYGFMDQLAALQWVQRNIASFGGDPGDVTVFGESAGGFGVHVLMTSPLAKGLFHKAIAQSGGGRTGFVPGRRLRERGPGGLPSGEEVGVTFAATLGIGGDAASALAALRAQPADKIVAGLNMITLLRDANTFSNSMIDGQLIVDEPQQIYNTGRQQKVPLIVGATDLDLGFTDATTIDQALAPFGPAKRQAALAAYDPLGSGDGLAVAARVASDRLMVEPARFTAKAIAAQSLPVYEYRFAYVADALRSKRAGAAHASELAYVFDTLGASYPAISAQDQQMAKQIQDYWVSFVKTGNPNGGDRPQWPAYEVRSDRLFDFSAAGPTKSAAVADPWKARMDLVEQLY
ncbi:MAG: carboxylesterase family protein [Pseudomonadota bacterium]